MSGGCGRAFRVERLTSALFCGKAPLARHRLVTAALSARGLGIESGAGGGGPLHALSVGRAWAPGEQKRD